MKTKQEQIKAIKRIIDERAETIIITQDIVEAGYGDIRQAQIDVLNKLKERAIGYTFLGEKLATETDIDGLIEEIENKQCF